ncbi:MAG: glycerol-3-phosphate dehydrogenase/oxidase [Candidatus Eremiobacteraeota bacterium]|nr:glycerol-3-phosphate dehydrogenase/oxidase [Candidatus Eremiobacteraeota bacterium]
MNRDAALRRLEQEQFDVLIVGGGATGLGAALDAAARGYRTALIEARDFGSGTSSRSTKLIHGGVRYLRQGNLRLVHEALYEREILRRNAPDMVAARAFVIPARHWWEIPYYAAALVAYDVLAGRSSFPRSRIVSAANARRAFPALAASGLRGGVIYYDGQFNDARLALAIARAASERGAVLASDVRAQAFVRDLGDRIAGVRAVEQRSGAEMIVRARVAINAAGPFADVVRALDDPSSKPLLALSRGSHILVPAERLGSPDAALLVPRTADGRVLFAIPWQRQVMIGTTDVPVDAPVADPSASDEEIAYILGTVNAVLAAPLSRSDVSATFAGLRPLLRRDARMTSNLSREHLVEISPSGLVTITGGKWTTYRKMAADAVDAAARVAHLAPARSTTAEIPLNDRGEPP